MQKENRVGEFLRKACVMRDHDTSKSQLELEPLNEIAKTPRSDGIDHGSGLVIQDDLRLRSQRTGHGYGAFSPRRQAGRESIDHIMRAGQADQPVDDLIYLVFGQAAFFAQGKGNVFSHAHGIEQGAILKDHRDALANCAQALLI